MHTDTLTTYTHQINGVKEVRLKKTLLYVATLSALGILSGSTMAATESYGHAAGFSLVRHVLDDNRATDRLIIGLLTVMPPSLMFIKKIKALTKQNYTQSSRKLRSMKSVKQRGSSSLQTPQTCLLGAIFRRFLFVTAARSP